MTDDEHQDLLQKLAATQLTMTALAITLVEKRVLTKHDLIENLDAIGLGVSKSRGNPKTANGVVETLIARIQSAPIPD